MNMDDVYGEFSFLFFPFFFEKHSTISLRSQCSIQPFFVCICAVCLSSIWPVGCVPQSPKNKDAPLLPSMLGQRSKQICGVKWIQSNVDAMLLRPSLIFAKRRPPPSRPRLRVRPCNWTARAVNWPQGACVNSVTLVTLVYLGCTTMKIFPNNLENLLVKWW